MGFLGKQGELLLKSFKRITCAVHDSMYSRTKQGYYSVSQAMQVSRKWKKEKQAFMFYNTAKMEEVQLRG